MNSRCARHGFAAVCVLFTQAVQSQGVDAGALLRQTEQSYRSLASQRAVSKLITPIEAPLTLPAGVTVNVAQFNFQGVSHVKPEALQAVTASFANRDLGSADLDNLCSTIVDAYRQAGWVVRVYVPRQTLPASTLTLQVLETVPPPSPK